MAEPIYRNHVSYMAVLNDEHNGAYLRIVEEAIAELGGDLKLSWTHSFDPEEYEPDEIEESLERSPFYLKTLHADGEPQDFVIFVDSQHSVDLTGASEEWILLVNRILRRLDAYNGERFDSISLDGLNGRQAK